VSFVIFVVNEIKVIVPGYPHRNLKSHNLRESRGDYFDMSGSEDGAKNFTVDHATVRVLYFGLVRNVVKEAEEDISLPAGSKVRELVEILCRKHGEALRDALFTVEGTLTANTILLLDGTNIQYARGLDTEMGDDQALHILLTTTALAGG
jgi:molybdopterin converting factor small subunit